jgi:hypothetical protein
MDIALMADPHEHLLPDIILFVVALPSSLLFLPILPYGEFIQLTIMTVGLVVQVGLVWGFTLWRTSSTARQSDEAPSQGSRLF